MNEYPLSGPGSQPAEGDGAELDILQMPSGMETYAQPSLPEPEDVTGLEKGLELLRELSRQLHGYAADTPADPIDLEGLDEANRSLVDQVLGEGEVSIVLDGSQCSRIQESVLAGVWRLQQRDEAGQLIADRVEIGAIPREVVSGAFEGARDEALLCEPLPPGVLNAPPLFAEINEYIRGYQPGNPSHVINLTLLPQTEADLGFLQQQLGAGRVSILSRGYGNCRISSSGTRNVWWVQYFNSQDKNILNSLEITRVPNVACAAPEDLADSAERLDEILEIYL
ncbi:MAG: hydrogenase expression/formation protein [Candidatus Thiodiazotropha sp.]